MKTTTVINRVKTSQKIEKAPQSVRSFILDLCNLIRRTLGFADAGGADNVQQWPGAIIVRHRYFHHTTSTIMHAKNRCDLFPALSRTAPDITNNFTPFTINQV
ncbi:hypothetical protein RRG08_020840 [Elysia crispata]|uniref:Uncharacterized protein n=1 Tax=Elysia crispata TaxID=231223 RepID=A0AAE0XVB8_9GAST|nr:hypothetical protein RRG08_020840 [Elysia crispata]